MTWFKRHKRKLLFFVVFFLVCGTSSIWLPWIFLDFGLKDFAIGLLTISIASICSSAERLLEMIKNRQARDNEDIVELIAVVVPLLSSIVMVALLNYEHVGWAVLLSVVLYFAYCRLWWFQNRDNENFADAIGGDCKQFKG